MYGVACCTLVFFLSACGFQLRGLSVEQDTASVIVSGVQAGHPIIHYINRHSSVEKKKDESVQLVILNENWKKNVVSVNELGQAKEYELRYTVLYEVFGVHKKRLKTASEISIVRNVLNDVNNVLSVSREEEKLRRDMMDEFSERFLRLMSVISLSGGSL